MKKDKKMFILIEAVLGSLVLVLAFVMLQEKNEKEKQKIAVIIENSDDNQWAGLKYGLKKAAEDRDVELSVTSTGPTPVSYTHLAISDQVKAFTLGLGEMTEDEREIILKGCLINYYRAK